MPLCFRAHVNDQASRMKILLEGRSYIIGRGEAVDIRITDPAVSRVHAKLHVIDGSWFLEDLNSKFGCYRGDARVAKCALGPPSTSFRLGQILCDAQPITYKEASSLGQQLAWRRNQIREASQVLAQPMELEQLATLATVTLQNLFPRERAALLLLDDAGDIVSACGNPSWSSRIEFRASRTAITRAVQEKKEVILANIQADQQLSNARSIVSHGVQSLLCVPVMFKDTVYAVLYADKMEVSDVFTELDLEVVRAYARQLGYVFGLRYIDQELAKTQIPL